MIDDINKIKEITNLEIGKIINEGVETYKGNGSNELGCIYDVSSYNFHLIPDDKELFEKYSKSIREKRKHLLKSLANKTKDKFDWHIETCGKLGSIYNLKNKTYNKYESGGNLFSFIRIRYKGILYDINFNRFYINNDKVYCKLYEPQFSCCKCNPGYPQSFESGKYSFGTMYYNPKNNFDNEDNLIEEFIHFVSESHKKML